MKWIEKKINSNGEYILLKDMELNSPSQAAISANGSSSSDGWSNFENKKGKTLGDVYRYSYYIMYVLIW